MSLNIVGRGYEFDEVMLVPRRSSGQSRQIVDLKTCISRNHTTKTTLLVDHPIVSANMDTVTGFKMALAMNKTGGCGILHRYQSLFSTVDSIKKLKADANRQYPLVVSVGISYGSHNQALAYWGLGVDAICVDVAHGHTDRVIQFVKDLKKARPDMHIIVGNIATGEAAQDLIEAGATGLKVGIGPGYVCRTRKETGCGVPQLTAIANVVAVAEAHDIPVIADGGIKSAGDIVKALAAGADAVMLGYLLAGTEESEGQKYPDGACDYRGMASRDAQVAWSGQAKHVEGVSTLVEEKGPVAFVIEQLLEGVRSGFSYCGAADLADLRTRAAFVTR